MRKCKQAISMLLVLCMMFAVISVGVVQGAAADGDTIYTDPPSEPALLGDINRDGRINGDDVLVLRKSITHNYADGYLDYKKMSKNSIDFKVADCYKDEEYGIEEKIDGNDLLLLRQYIVHKPEAQDKGIGEPVYVEPTEPPTQVPTDESTTATITIYGLNGQLETKEFNVGDSFVVYTSLNVKKAGSDVQIAAASGDQRFTDSVLTLSSEIDGEQLFTDTDTVFPVFGEKAMGRLREAGWVQYNASTPGVNNGFVFDSDDDLAIVTRYTVTHGGTGEVRNTLSFLAAADEDLTLLVNNGTAVSDTELTVNATFDKPVPAPTIAPTEAPKPTAAPTEAPKPTVAPTEAPKPTVAPTEAPKPTVAPTEAPKPTVAPTTPSDKAIVHVQGLDGETETKEFNVGDTFTVYTTLNASQINSGKIGSIDGAQLYPNAMIKLVDEYDDEGVIDLDAMFPITKSQTMGSGKDTSLENTKPYYDSTRGAVFFTASTPYTRGFTFNNNDARLIQANYQVTAPGEAYITIDMRTLCISDDDLTPIIFEWETLNPDFRLHSSFYWPESTKPTEDGTEAPEPTEAPKPTTAPTEAPKPTQAPTEAPEPTEAPTEPAPEDVYIVAGNATDIFGTAWNANDANNTMTKGSDSIYTRQYTVSSAMKDVQLKAVKNGTSWIGDETGNNVTFNLTGAGTFTVYCDGTKTWVDGDIISYEDDLVINSVTAVGNGATDGDGWLNNEFWNEKAASNHMTKVSDGIYEAEYTLGEYDTNDPEFKFAINDAWTHNFGLGDNGVIANGVTTDAIYNGSTNLKITGLTAGTTIKMQLDLTGFDFSTKTGAKMTVTWTAPAEPTEAPTEAPKPTEAPTEAPKPTEAPTEAPKPTEAPTEAPKPTEAPTEAPKPTEAPTEAPKPTEAPTEAPKPTEAPTTPSDKAIVHVQGLDGETETKEFNVGDTFTVYTTLNASQINSGKIGSIDGAQLYPNSMIKLVDEYDDEGIIDLDAMFPITKSQTMASGKDTSLENIKPYYDSTRGAVFFLASMPYERGFVFNNNSARLIQAQYQVTAPGEAYITIDMRTLCISDNDLTPIIFEWETLNPNFRLHSSFDWSESTEPTENETEAPKPTAAPTEAPKPTEAPTEAPVPTVAPTTASEKAIVHVQGLDGETETKEFNVGDTFTVYTTLNASQINSGKIGSIDGAQLYPNSMIKLVDEYDDEGIIDLDAMFPITKSQTMASGKDTSLENIKPYYDSTRGAVFFLASMPYERGFVFNNNSARLIQTNYQVTAPGEAYITINMRTLCIADYNLTPIIFEWETLNPNFRLHSSFDWSESTEPTEDETEAPKPTAAPTEAPKPTEAPTEAPKPTEAPTEAPKPTEAPTEAPKPTEAPTEAPKPTEAPTEAPKPTEAPTTPSDKAIVHVRGLDGETETKEFNVGDTFTVYTTLNASQINSGKIGSIDGAQLYPNAMIKLVDEYDEEGVIDLDAMFPITKSQTMGSGKDTSLENIEPYYDSTRGAVFFTASTPYERGFVFNNNDARLIQAQYQVTAPGEAYITIDMRTLCIADKDLTPIIFEWETLNPDFRLHSSFYWPESTKPTEDGTEAPEPTEAPKPTTAPTEAPKPTTAPTTPPVTLADGYYLVGTMTDWKADSAYQFSENAANPGEYMLSTTLAANDGVKAVKVENGAITTWYPEGAGNEYVVDAAHAGDVTIYFKTTYQSDWSTFGGYLYIDGGSTPTPDPTTAPTESSDVTDRTIIFSNNKGFSTVNIYYWADEDQPVNWPGVPMTYLDTNELGEKRYTIELPAGMTNYVINDGGTQQTVDIDFTGATGVYMTDKDSSGNYAVAFYDIGKTDPTPEPTTAPQPTTPTPTEAAKNYVYLNAGGSNLWEKDNPRFELYVWNDGQVEGEWLSATKVGSTYRFELPSSYTSATANCIFVRENPAGAAGSWDSVWNQTDDLSLNGNIGKTYTITGWGSNEGKWS